MITEKKGDKRTERTKKAITEAFTDLIIEKEYSEITVTELAECAGINRKTFYSHYECIEDVLDEMQLEIAERIVEIYLSKNHESFDVKAFSETLMAILEENYSLYRRILVANSYRFFSRNIKDLLKDSFLTKLTNASDIDKEEMNLMAEFCVTGLAKIYKVWFENPSGISEERVTELAGRMLWNGLSSFVNKR